MARRGEYPQNPPPIYVDVVAPTASPPASPECETRISMSWMMVVSATLVFPYVTLPVESWQGCELYPLPLQHVPWRYKRLSYLQLESIPFG
jgi:hypothetical protein